MRYTLKQYLTLSFFIISVLKISTVSVLAATYGDGEFGVGNYNVGAVEVQSNTSNTGATTNTGFSDSFPSSCADQIPGKQTPWLYAAVAQNSAAILLYFTDADGPVSHYSLLYGTEPGIYTWGATNIGALGMRTFLVSHLKPSTTYYFKVRAGNGCATGEWSNELSARTKSSFNFNQLEIFDVTIDPLLTTSQSILDSATSSGNVENNSVFIQQTDTQKFSITVKIKDEASRPIVGAQVSVDSELLEKNTDAAGFAQFEDITSGEHKIFVTHHGYTAQQSIYLSGEHKEIDLTITLNQRNVLISPFASVLFSVFIGLLIFFLALYMKKFKKS